MIHSCLIKGPGERQLPSVLEGAPVGAVGPNRGENETHHFASWLPGAELMEERARDSCSTPWPRRGVRGKEWSQSWWTREARFRLFDRDYSLKKICGKRLNLFDL